MSTNTKRGLRQHKMCLKFNVQRTKRRDIKAGALSRAGLKFHTWREPRSICARKLFSEKYLKQRY